MQTLEEIHDRLSVLELSRCAIMATMVSVTLMAATKKKKQTKILYSLCGVVLGGLAHVQDLDQIPHSH